MPVTQSYSNRWLKVQLQSNIITLGQYLLCVETRRCGYVDLHVQTLLQVTVHLFLVTGYVVFPDCLEEKLRPLDEPGIEAVQKYMSPSTHFLARLVGSQSL